MPETAFAQRLAAELASAKGQAELYAAGRRMAAAAWEGITAGQPGDSEIPGPPRDPELAAMAAAWPILVDVARGVAAESVDRVASLASPSITKSLGLGMAGGLALGVMVGRALG